MASSDTDPAYALSEVESIDSDWLDLSSRASEGNASLSDIESDRESLSRPLSRQSSLSSSGVSDRDGWEGLVDNNTDDEAPVERGDGPALPSVADTGTIRVRAGDVAVLRQVDELQERQALEQSMVSTLNSSRGGSLAASTSATSPLSGSARTRDLRLSFPDPLSGSRDELNSSYGDVMVDASLAPSMVGTESNKGEPVKHQSAVSQLLSSPDLQLVLYGNSSPDSHAIVNTLIEKLGEGLNYTIAGPELTGGDVYYTLLERSKQTALTVRVADRTGIFAPPSFDSPRSLAVVFLPAMLQALPRHALYLPIASSADPAIIAETTGADAKRQWASLETSSCRLLHQHSDPASSVFSGADISALHPSVVARAFQPLLPRQRPAYRALRDQVAAVPAVTLIAILSIVLGYIVSVSSPMGFQVQKPPATTVAKQFADVPYPTAMPSSSLAAVNFSSSLVVKPASSLSTYSPAAQRHTSASPASALTPATNAISSRVVSPNSAARCNTASSCAIATSLTAVPSSSTSSRSRVKAGALSLVPPSVKSLIAVPKKEHALSIRPSTDVAPESATRSAAPEVRELAGALDSLQRAIGGQASSLISALPSMSSIQSGASTAHEQLRLRNDRARDRAQRLRKRGEQVLWEAHERAWGRVEHARRRAREIHARTEEEAAQLFDYVQRSGREWAEKQREAHREARRTFKDRPRCDKVWCHKRAV